ncbi:hypothetical protein CQW23_21660 [Capsicum baccatum]|uniref:Importin N-terminal domain-containing protein n=1 Tax=Capsicum baccatum TaxID=33114 RepID=A0A2G2VYL7_CAPBA|nr:hypothetical protein CQW23_21660 [Capsicum baccatum]
MGDKFGSYSFINVSSGNEVPRWFSNKSEQRLLTLDSLPNVKTAGSGADLEEVDSGDSIFDFDGDDEYKESTRVEIEELFERSWLKTWNNASAGKSVDIRQAAGLLLKYNLRAAFQNMPPANQQCIKLELLPSLGAADRHIRFQTHEGLYLGSSWNMLLPLIYVMLCIDYGPCVSGVDNSIVTARDERDLISCLVSGTMLQLLEMTLDLIEKQEQMISVRKGKARSSRNMSNFIPLELWNDIEHFAPPFCRYGNMTEESASPLTSTIRGLLDCKVDHICLTHVCSETAGGLPGITKVLSAGKTFVPHVVMKNKNIVPQSASALVLSLHAEELRADGKFKAVSISAILLSLIHLDGSHFGPNDISIVDNVIDPPIPGPIVLIVYCPTKTHAQELLSSQALEAYYLDSQSNSPETTKVVNCIIHKSCYVINSPVYEKWMRKFDSAQHIMARNPRSITPLNAYFRSFHIKTGS